MIFSGLPYILSVMRLFHHKGLTYFRVALLLFAALFSFPSCELFRTMFFGPLYGITLHVGEGGSVSMIPEADKIEDNIYYFREGTSVTFTADAEDEYRFTGWSGDMGRQYAADLTVSEILEDLSVAAGFSSFTTSWTVLVYLDGDNDLESYAISDFNEMEYGLYLAQEGDPDILDKIAVAVQFDRGSYYSGSFDGPWGTTRRYQVMPDEDSLGCGSSRLADLGELNMGDAETLMDFVEWGKASFPAENYALVLWNHGGGARSLTSGTGTRDICVDETDDDILYIGEITDVLGYGHSVDLLGFDACLMGTIETACEYRPKTDGFGARYMTASPANEQGDGWEYDQIFARLAGSGSSDDEGDPCYDADALEAEDFARLLVKEYQDAFSHYNDQTMSAFDLSAAGGVKTAVDALATELAEYRTEVAAVRGSAVYYYGYGESWIWPYYELGSLCDVLIDANITQDISDAAEAIKTALGSFIISAWAGSYYGGYDDTLVSGYRGASIFFSENSADYDYQWWYTDEDTAAVYNNPDYLYGKLDFCSTTDDSTVNTWKELFDHWYLP